MNAMIAPVTYSVRGKVIDRQSRQPVAYANVFVAGIPGKGVSTDSLGTFKIEQVPPGIYSLEASCIGYQTVSTPEYIVSASTLLTCHACTKPAPKKVPMSLSVHATSVASM